MKWRVALSGVTRPAMEEHVSVAALAGRRAIRITNGAVNVAVLIVVLLLLVIGGYALWDSKQVYATADSSRYAIYKPTDDNGGLSFAELQELNDDVCAWIEVYGTHIDYPIVQGSDNTKYVNTDAAGKYSLSGAIFLDSNCSRDFSDFNSILYGHHMEKQAMFGEIGLFSDKSYFDARRYGMLYYGGREHGLEFFAFVHASAYDSTVFRTKITTQKAKQGYLDMIVDRAKNTRSINVTADDHIILLSTCSSSSTNGRDILVGKITDELFENPFGIEQASSQGDYIVNGYDSLWRRIPPLGKALFAITLCLVALVLLITLKDKRRERMHVRSNNGGMSA